MLLHAMLPAEREDEDPTSVAEMAAEAEELGFAGVWLPDHLLPPEPFGESYGGPFDAVTVLAYVAARTRTVELGTSVLVLPLRDPFVLAKQAGTLAALSGGRFVLGVGAGWERHEFDALGVDHATRGRRTTSAIRLIRHLQQTGGAAFQDPFYGHPGGRFAPVTPVPILVGGTSEAALRRAASVGDRWQAFALSPAQFAQKRRRLGELGGGHVRCEARMQMSTGHLVDAVDDVVHSLPRWLEAGAESLGVWFGPDVASATVRLRELAARPEVAAHLVTG